MRVLLGLEKIRERAGVYAEVIQITVQGDLRHTGVPRGPDEDPSGHCAEG